MVVTSFPIGEILHNRDATGRIAMWEVELGSFELTFQPRTAIKSQALVNFIAEWTEVQTDNNEADELAKIGSKRTPAPTGVFVQQLYQPTISEEATEPVNKPIEAEVLTIDPDWTTPYLSYLLHDELPEDRAEAERIARRSRRYVVVGGKELYRKGTSDIHMRCISKEDGRRLLKEIH